MPSQERLSTLEASWKKSTVTQKYQGTRHTRKRGYAVLVMKHCSFKRLVLLQQEQREYLYATLYVYSHLRLKWKASEKGYKVQNGFWMRKKSIGTL